VTDGLVVKIKSDQGGVTLAAGAETLLRIGAHTQSLAYVYGRETKADADIANVLTMDETRRIASNIAKLPDLLKR
jgi:hypothetical protein